MCLSTIYNKKETTKLIKKHQKNGFITVWKVFRKYELSPKIEYNSPIFYEVFFSGKNETNKQLLHSETAGYIIGFHSFLKKYQPYLSYW